MRAIVKHGSGALRDLACVEFQYTAALQMNQRDADENPPAAGPADDLFAHAAYRNVARGKVVDEPALMEALRAKIIAGAAIDCAWEEPLPESSPLWSCPNLVITPHCGDHFHQHGRVPVAIDNIALMGPHLKAKNLKPLAVKMGALIKELEIKLQ